MRTIALLALAALLCGTTALGQAKAPRPLDLDPSWLRVHLGTGALVLRQETRLRVYDTRSGQLLREQELDAKDVAANDRYLVLHTAGEDVRLTDTISGRELRRYPGAAGFWLAGSWLHLHLDEAPHHQRVRMPAARGSRVDWALRPEGRRIGDVYVQFDERKRHGTRLKGGVLRAFDIARSRSSWSHPIGEFHRPRSQLKSAYFRVDQARQWLPSPDGQQLALLMEGVSSLVEDKGAYPRWKPVLEHYIWWIELSSGKLSKIGLRRYPDDSDNALGRWLDSASGPQLLLGWEDRRAGGRRHDLYASGKLRARFGPGALRDPSAGIASQIVSGDPESTTESPRWRVCEAKGSRAEAKVLWRGQGPRPLPYRAGYALLEDGELRLKSGKGKQLAALKLPAALEPTRLQRLGDEALLVLGAGGALRVAVGRNQLSAQGALIATPSPALRLEAGDEDAPALLRCERHALLLR